MSIRKSTLQVIYSIKNESGFLVDKTKTFNSHKDARAFLNTLTSTGKMIGVPIFVVK